MASPQSSSCGCCVSAAPPPRASALGRLLRLKKKCCTDKPLLKCLGERGCIVMGLCVNFSYFLGYLLIVNNLYWVFVFTAK